jgi:hypothetical protein
MGRVPYFAGSSRIWQTHQIFQFLNICSRVVIGHFRTATWYPMTGPHGIQPLGHVNHYIITLSRQHTIFQLSCQLILPCQLTM